MLTVSISNVLDFAEVLVSKVRKHRILRVIGTRIKYLKSNHLLKLNY